MKKQSPRPPTPWQARRERWNHICPESRDTENAGADDAAWWTFLLLLTHQLFSTNTLFAGMKSHGVEASWAVGTGSVVALRLLARIVPAPIIRFVQSLSAVFVFAFISVAISQSCPYWHHIPAATGSGVYALRCFYNARCAFRIARFAVADVVQFTDRIYRIYRRYMANRPQKSRKGQGSQNGGEA